MWTWMGNKRGADSVDRFPPYPRLKIGEEKGRDGCPPFLGCFFLFDVCLLIFGRYFDSEVRCVRSYGNII